MKHRNILLATAVMLGLGLNSFAGESKHTEQRSLEGNGVLSLHVDTGAGDVILQGSADVEDMQVTVTVWGDYIEDDDYELNIEKSGSRATLYMHMRDGYRGRGSVDLEVLVPEHWALEVDDRSGELSVSNMRNGLRVDDRSGDLHIRDISGGVKVSDRSGDLSLITITGDIEIDDRSGDIEVITATGNLALEDSSGDITIRTVSGDVEIDDSSGDMDITDVGGDVTASDGSGDIYVRDASRFTLRSDGSGDVHLENVSKQ